MSNQEATAACELAACPDHRRVPNTQALADILHILPPGNGQRSEATINGHHVKRQAARYLIDGQPAYSIADALERVNA